MFKVFLIFNLVFNKGFIQIIEGIIMKIKNLIVVLSFSHFLNGF